MSTRNGKIARLPRHIRHQLNLRLEDAEESPELLDWLNALPEVQDLVQKQFAGVPISKQNLSQWRQGGFLEAMARRDFAQDLQDFAELAAETENTCPKGELADQAAVLLAARFGALLANWNGEPDEKFAAKVKILNSIGKTIGQLQRHIHRSRRELLEMQVAREENDKIRKKTEDAKLTARWTDLAKAPAMARYFGGGTGGRKIADYILALQRGDPAELNLDPADTFDHDRMAPVQPVAPSHTQSK